MKMALANQTNWERLSMPCIQFLGHQHIFPDKLLPLPRFLHGTGGGSHGYQIQLMSSFRCQECLQPASPHKALG